MLYCTVLYCIHIATVTYSYEKVRTVSIVDNSNLKKRAFRTALSEKPVKLKSERALLVISTHHQNKKSIPNNRLELLENYDWDFEI